MSADLPIWPTTKAILLYCWQERWLALRYALVPVALLILMDAGGTAAGIDIAEDKVWAAVSSIAALLAFMPLMVTWYYAVVFGHQEAARRPIFTFGKREGAVLGTNILVALVIGVAIIPLGGLVALGGGAVGYFNQLAGQVVAVILGIPAVFIWFMIMTRMSVVIAYSAAGQHLSLRDAWRVTKPFGVSITWTHLILGVIGVGVASAATAVVAYGLEAAGLGNEDGASPVIDLAVSATDAVFGIVYLVLATTLFGVVYRHLAAQSPAPATAEILMAIIAPEGSPLSVAVIGVADMEASLKFYRDLIGLTVSQRFVWSEPDFAQLWHLPDDASADTAFCELPGMDVGRVLLMAFNTAKRKAIRPLEAPRAFGLVNLNFYTDDIARDAKMFASHGYKFWSEPTHYELSGSVGAPTEVIFDGPDTVAINLVELATSDPNTRVGQMRAYVQDHGRTPTGFTPVVTSSHCARSVTKAVAFYEQVLKMGVLIDAVLGSPAQNKFLRIPEKGRTAIKFMQGNHMFGKVALSQPLNYPCMDIVHNAVAPNIGYIAQTFEVRDFAAAKTACDAMKVDVYTPPMDLDLPGFGRARAMIVRNPGSGALQQIVQKL